MPNASLRFRAAFDEGDSAGIVHFAHYFRLAHRALEAWLPSRGIPWEEWFASSRHAVPLRHADAEFFRPLRPGQEFDIAVEVEEIDDSTVKFAFLLLTCDGERIARVTTTHVFVSLPDFRRMDIPSGIRDRIVN